MTPNQEDYLKALCSLGGNDGRVSNQKLAEELKVSPASVSEMLGKLSKSGYVDYEPYKGSSLTRPGVEKAVLLLRSHRLWEVFLKRHLGYSWSEIHEDAHRLEHVTSPQLAQRLDDYLKHPFHCPHGSTIPQKDGHIETKPLRTLNRLAVGETSVIRRVNEEKELLEYLKDLGLEIGMPVTLLAVGAYEGPLTLDLNGNEVDMSYKASCQIYIDEKPT